MIGPINTATSTNGASNSISKESQQDIEYKQPQINESGKLSKSINRNI